MLIVKSSIQTAIEEIKRQFDIEEAEIERRVRKELMKREWEEWKEKNKD